MQITSMIAIYFLSFVMSIFFVLPFGMKTHDEAGVAKIAGQADSAPVQFDLWKVLRRSAVVGAVLAALYIANYNSGWITLDDINPVPKAPRYDGAKPAD